MGRFCPFYFVIDLANFKIQNLSILIFLIKNMAIIDTTGLEPFADLLKEIYGDLAKPGVAQVGIALATVIGLLNTCLSPIKFLNEKTELNRQNNLEQLAKRFSEIPPENIVEAPPEIAVPIAEKLTYVSNEDLRKLYIELLAKASTKEKNVSAHPSFINIINSLSPDEANLIKYLKIKGDLPFADIVRKAGNGMVQYLERLVCLTPGLELVFQQNLNAYLSHLVASGLIEVNSDRWLSGEQAYAPYQEYLESKIPYYEIAFRNLPKDTSSPQPYRIDKGTIMITDFGNLFISAVVE